MSEKKDISMFLSDKPKIEAIGQSNLLSRLKTFLPQMEEANKSLKEQEGNEDFLIETAVEESSSSSSSSDDESSDEKDDVEMEEGDKEKKPIESRIEIDVDVFREQNSAVDNRDVSVQQVEKLPEAFRTEPEEKEKEKEKGPLIEEL